jgi:hypothetical protein
MTGGKDFVKRYERDVLHGSEFKNKRGRKPDTGGRKRREKGGKPGSKSTVTWAISQNQEKGK